MTAEEFTEQLRQIPTKSVLDQVRTKGVSDEFVKEFRDNHYFIKNDPMTQFEKDPIRDLVNNYNGSTVQIGGISFDFETIEDEDYFYFAEYEVDVFALNKNLNTIVLLEFGTDNHVLCAVAGNSSLFLMAILEAAKFYVQDDDVCLNQAITCQMAEYCAEIAGGNDYLSFYKMLLACFE